MPAMWSAVIVTPLPDGWRFAIRCDVYGVYETAFLPRSAALREPDSACARQAVSIARAYFTRAYNFGHIDIVARGTPFQQRVWQALTTIPPGRPTSYGVLARQLGSSARAVAGACRANPVPLFIPCHRVVAANGPGGYMGATEGECLRLKNWLLHHEAND